MAKFKVGDKVRAKDPAWPGYQGHALGHDVYVVKKVDWDGTVKLDGFIDVWVSPGSLVSANAACNAKWVILYRDGGKEKIDAPTHDAAKKVADERSRKSGRGYVSVIVDDGMDYGVNAVRSRNAVTDKSWDGKQLSVGDWVRQKDSGLIGRIVGKYNYYLWNVKWRNGNDTFVEGAAPDDLVFMRHDTTSINSVRSRNAVVQKALNAVAVAKARNDKWIDDFHVIVTAGKPDPALLEAIKKKAAAWKVAKRNFSNRTAADAHDKATDDAMAIAKRLGARWIQQGAVTRVVMPNADTSVPRETALNGSDDAVLRLCRPSNIIQRGKTENLHEVRYGGGYIYPVVSRDGVLIKVYGSLSEANRRALNANGDKAKQPWWNESKGIKGLYAAHRSHMSFDNSTWDAWHRSNFVPDRGQKDTDKDRYFYDEASRDKFIRDENRKNGFIVEGGQYVLKGYIPKTSWNARSARRN